HRVGRRSASPAGKMRLRSVMRQRVNGRFKTALRIPDTAGELVGQAAGTVENFRTVTFPTGTEIPDVLASLVALRANQIPADLARNEGERAGMSWQSANLR